MVVFDNLNELREKYRAVAESLLAEHGEGQWVNEKLYYYGKLADFAEYELTEGWYMDCNFDRDFRGAPNPLDYIDLEALGEALSNRWDESMYWTDGDDVVGTSCGW